MYEPLQVSSPCIKQAKSSFGLLQLWQWRVLFYFSDDLMLTGHTLASNADH